jgi:uncharacterized membrane protein SpoIIM required for sporulation
MRPDELIRARKEDWDALARLVERAQHDIRSLTPQEVDGLSSLYRAAASDLALARRDFPRHQLTEYLNQLVAHAHAIIYREQPMAARQLVQFFARDFPRLFRRTFIFTLAAFLLLFVPALAAGAATTISPVSATWLLPAQVQNLIPLIEEGELWTDIAIRERPYASAFIMQNNLRVSFLAFGSGISGGLLTLLVLATNGLIMGGLLGLTAHYGVGFGLATFMVGHGVMELSVIFIAGGSGLMLGWALLRPGLLRRRDALALASRDAVRLLLGAAPLLIVAGLIEGFVSPAENIGWQVKWGIGIASGVLLYTYLLLAGREKRVQG